MTRPNACVAESKSSHVAPPAERAIRASGVDVDRPHRRQVDDETVVAHAVPRRVVAAATNGDLEPTGAGEVQRCRDVGRAGTSSDDGRPAIDESVEADARRVVALVARLEHRRRRPTVGARSGPASGAPAYAGLSGRLGSVSVHRLHGLRPEQAGADGGRGCREERADEERRVVAAGERLQLARCPTR